MAERTESEEVNIIQADEDLNNLLDSKYNWLQILLSNCYCHFAVVQIIMFEFKFSFKKLNGCKV